MSLTPEEREEFDEELRMEAMQEAKRDAYLDWLSDNEEVLRERFMDQYIESDPDAWHSYCQDEYEQQRD